MAVQEVGAEAMKELRQSVKNVGTVGVQGFAAVAVEPGVSRWFFLHKKVDLKRKERKIGKKENKYMKLKR